MTRFLFVAVTVAALTLAPFGCKKDDNPDPTPCEQVADLTESALAATCTPDASCVFCDCAGQGLEMDVTVDGSDLVYSCGEPVTCDASEAEVCLADEAACVADMASAAETLCASSVPEL